MIDDQNQPESPAPYVLSPVHGLASESVEEEEDIIEEEEDITDDLHPPEPFVPIPANNPTDGPLPGEGQDDTPDPSVEESEEWDEEVIEEADLTDAQEAEPLPPS